jgi:hypothetical protein
MRNGICIIKHYVHVFVVENVVSVLFLGMYVYMFRVCMYSNSETVERFNG